MTLPDAPPGDVPQPIVRILRRLVRRVRAMIVLRGVLAVAAVLFGALLVVMAIDASVTLFSQGTRWMLTLGVWAVTLVALVHFLILPLARSFTMSGTARIIERNHPELQERLSSTVELLTSRDMPEIRGSDVLIGALAEQATEDAAGVQPRREVPLRSIKPFIIAAACVALVLAGLFIVWRGKAVRLFARAVAPYLNLPNVAADQLTVLPGDKTVLEGSRVDVEVLVANPAVGEADFRKVGPDGKETVERMTPLPPTEDGRRRFVLSQPSVDETFRYRIHAGDALTQHFTIDVVSPAVVSGLDVRYAYPEYTGLAPKAEPDSDGTIRGVAGTVVTVAATLDRPVVSAELMVGKRPMEDVEVETAASEGGGRCVFTMTLAPKMRGTWSLRMTDRHGFASESPARPLEARPDQAPAVAIVRPAETKLTLRPDERLPLAYTIDDDYGIGEAALVVEFDGSRRAAMPVASGDGAHRAAVGQATLDLAALPLAKVRRLTFRLRATDRLPEDLDGPHVGYSEVYTVELDVAAQDYERQVAGADERTVREGIERILKELRAAKGEAKTLVDLVAKTKTLEKRAAEAADDLRGRLMGAEAMTRDLADRAAEGIYGGIGPKFEPVAAHIAAGAERAGRVKLADTTDERIALVAKADGEIDQAIALLQSLPENFDRMVDAVRLARDLADLADREAALAETKAAMEWAEGREASPAEMSPQEWAQEQAELTAAMGDLVAETPEAMEAALEAGAGRAAELAAEALELEAEQRDLMDETGLLARLEATNQALADLADEQEALAGSAAALSATVGEADGMADAADEIREGRLPEAVADQAAAESALGEIAKGLAAAETGEGMPAGVPPAEGQPAGAPPAEGQPAGAPPAEGPPAGQPAASPAQAAGQMAARQSELRERTEGLMARRNDLMAQLAAGAMERLRQEQEAIAREAEQLARGLGQSAPASQPLGQQAAQSAASAAANLPQNVARAAQNAGEAASQLDQIASDLHRPAAAQPSESEPSAAQPAAGQPSAGEPAAGQPSAGQPSAGEPSAGQPSAGQPSAGEPSAGQPSAGQPSAPAQEAGGLAERQEQVARELQAWASSNVPAAMAAQQAAIAHQAAALQQQAGALGPQAAGMVPAPAPAQASEAAGMLGQAAQQASRATAQMEAAAPSPGAPSPGAPSPGAPSPGVPSPGAPSPGAPGPGMAAAQPAQQAAAQALGQAARALQSMSQGMAAAAAGLPPSAVGQPESGVGPAMADALGAAAQASQAQSAPAAASAARAMSAAAAAAAAQAQAMGAAPGAMPGMGTQPGMAPGMPAATLNSMAGTGVQNVDERAADLKKLGISLSDWARLPGRLRDQILQAAEASGPQEYRSLIRDYFREVAKRGGETGDE